MPRLVAATISASLLLLVGGCGSAPAQTPASLPTHELTGAASDYDPLMSAIGDAHLVLLGEATHGTREFYEERAKITKRLVTEKKFTGLALEADWADAARIDRYVRGASSDTTAEQALGGFDRFPRWMWRNREFADLVSWIRSYNDSLPNGTLKVGVYGLDLYGLEDSRKAVQTHLQTIDPALAAAVARMKPDRQIEAIRERREKTSDRKMMDELFAAEQNARVVRNAEEYYREQEIGRVSTWNLRDRHMVATMAAVQSYLMRRNGRDHIVVWAHNSHVGDARATGQSRLGEYNIGQLVRENWPRHASFTVGFTTHNGTVLAADNWDDEPRVHELRDSIAGSHGAIFHEVGVPRFLLLLAEVDARVVRTARQQRAVGVVYRPRTELESHYFPATLREQFDAVIHIDRTQALTPIDPLAR